MPLAEPGPGEPLVGARSVKDEWIPDGERDPGTIAEEQRRRSAFMEAGATMEEAATTDLPDPTEGQHKARHSLQHQRKDDPYTQQHTGTEGQQQHQGKSQDAEKRDAEIHKSAPAPHSTKK